MIIGTTYISDIIGDRMDVQFWIGANKYVEQIKRIPHKPLGEIALFSSESWNQKSVFVDFFPYIEIGAIDTVNGEISKIETVLMKDAPSRAKKIIRRNDILISTTRPNRGAICLYEGYDICIASTGFSVIRETSERVLKKYLLLVLRLPCSLEQMMRRSSGGNYPAIIESELKKILIPTPSIEVQNCVIKIYSKALYYRTNKRQEAEKLLGDIDDYLLDVLQVNDNSIKGNKVKETIKNVSDLIGNRLDVSFYLEKFEMVSTKYPNVKLSAVVDIDPSIKFNKLAADDTISFVPMECIDEEFGEISNYQEITIAKTKGYTKFKENDLLWAKITPCMQNGKSAIARNLTNGVGCGSTEYYVLRPKSDGLLIDYVYLILRHHKVLEAAQSSFGGSAGQQRVSSQYLKSIKIPYPDISMQKDIVRKVYEMKDKAKRLQLEGDASLEKAKQEIEKMIIG